jgi:YebC/PmpR family DNA-binding regulatory protein
MAGHSKWANIKHKKERADAKKGKVFSRVTKEIITAVKLGGSDPKTNARLRLVLQKAKAVNLPQDNIERNIKKATSATASDYADVMYELYGHGGVGILCEGLTDNKNRTASDLRIATNKRGGVIASPGAVSYQFERKGVIQVAKEGFSSDTLFMLVSDLGAEDFEEIDDSFIVTTAPEALYTIKEALEKENCRCLEAELEMIPKVWVECDAEAKEKNLALLEWLENLEDIDIVTHNMKLEE